MSPSPQPRTIWSRDFTLLFIANLVAWTGMQVYGPVLPIYLTTKMGASLTQVGLIATAMTSVDVVARLLSGYLMEVVGRRRLAIVALLALAAIGFTFSLPASLALVALLRVSQGIPMAASSTTIHTMASDTIPTDRVGEGMSYYSLGTTLSIAIGPIMALAVLGHDRFGLAFAVAGACALVGVVLISVLQDRPTRFRLQKFTWSALIEPRTAWLVLATALIYAAFAAQSSFVALYSVKLGLVPTSWFLGIYGVGTVISRAGTGHLFDKYGPVPSIASSVSLLALGTVLLGLSNSAAVFLLAGLITGIGFGIYAPAAYAMALHLVPVERRGAGNAMIVSSMGFGIGIGSAILGRLAEVAGYRTTYVAAGLSMVVPFVLFFWKVIPDYNQKCGVTQPTAPTSVPRA